LLQVGLTNHFMSRMRGHTNIKKEWNFKNSEMYSDQNFEGSLCQKLYQRILKLSKKMGRKEISLDLPRRSLEDCSS